MRRSESSRLVNCLVAGVATAGAVLSGASPAVAGQSPAAHDVIEAKYRSWGGADSPLGHPVGEAYPVGAGAGRDYAGGAIFYSPGTGAHVMYGLILERYRELGGPAGALGFPTTDEEEALGGSDRFSDFSAADGATVYWTPAAGAWLIRGPILDAWNHLGGAEGPMGHPVAAEVEADGVRVARFSGADGTAELSWHAGGGYAVVPPELTGRLRGLAVTAGLVTRAPAR